jgi:tetraacyldisaccharide 4'-kinase
VQGAALLRAWMRRGLLARSLLPLAWLYGALAGARRALYRRGVAHVEHVAVPVVVIGNVVAGGAGKTPVVIAVVEHLKAQDLRVGVVSRGYGRASDACLEVRPESPATQVGDEPLLVARRCGVPVFVAARRSLAAAELLKHRPETQVIVSDDGLQHLSMARDIEICVFDERGVGNGWLLPAGPLREPWPRPVDLTLRPPSIARTISGFAVERALASHALRADGTRVRLSDLAGAATAGVIAVAGIARPEAFFEMLRGAGLPLRETIALVDHHDFDAHPLCLSAGSTVLCTEKDAVKLWDSHPHAWAVPLTLGIEAGFWERLDLLVRAKLSSRDGSQTA